MKIRTGFVSNSSSSSFILVTKNIDTEVIKNMFWNHIIKMAYGVQGDIEEIDIDRLEIELYEEDYSQFLKNLTLTNENKVFIISVDDQSFDILNIYSENNDLQVFRL